MKLITHWRHLFFLYSESYMPFFWHQYQVLFISVQYLAYNAKISLSIHCAFIHCELLWKYENIFWKPLKVT